MLVTTGDKSERLRPCVSSLGKGWIWVLLTSWCQEHDPQAAWPHSALNLRLQISFSERDDFKRKKKKNFFSFLNQGQCLSSGAPRPCPTAMSSG